MAPWLHRGDLRASREPISIARGKAIGFVKLERDPESAWPSQFLALHPGRLGDYGAIGGIGDDHPSRLEAIGD
jgi:hypothetical protein